MSGDLLDSVGMFDLAAALPDQVAAAAVLGAEIDGLPDHEAIENVVVLGMGGSGVAGDVLAAIASPFMSVPVTVVKGHEAPSFVGPGTLCFAISYSGATEETLRARFKPIVASSLASVGARKQYDGLLARYRALPLAEPTNLDLDEYTTNKTLDGLFSLLADEERKIRKDPAKRTTSLLRKVFGI